MEHDQLIGEMTQIERLVFMFLGFSMNTDRDHLLQADHGRETQARAKETGNAAEALGAEGERIPGARQEG